MADTHEIVYNGFASHPLSSRECVLFSDGELALNVRSIWSFAGQAGSWVNRVYWKGSWAVDSLDRVWRVELDLDNGVMRMHYSTDRLVNFTPVGDYGVLSGGSSYGSALVVGPNNLLHYVYLRYIAGLSTMYHATYDMTSLSWVGYETMGPLAFWLSRPSMGVNLSGDVFVYCRQQGVVDQVFFYRPAGGTWVRTTDANVGNIGCQGGAVHVQADGGFVAFGHGYENGVMYRWTHGSGAAGTLAEVSPVGNATDWSIVGHGPVVTRARDGSVRLWAPGNVGGTGVGLAWADSMDDGVSFGAVNQVEGPTNALLQRSDECMAGPVANPNVTHTYGPPAHHVFYMNDDDHTVRYASEVVAAVGAKGFWGNIPVVRPQMVGR